jgi:hypothetical protein
MPLPHQTLERPAPDLNRRRSGEPSTTGGPPLPVDAVQHSIRHTALRGLGFGGLLGIALIHLLDVVSKMNETPYLGVMYVGLMISCVAVAFALLHTGSARAWAAGGLLAAATLTGFILSRTTGLPSSSGDIGNWSERLGLASMFVEGMFVVLSGYAIWLSRRESLPGVHVAISPTAAGRLGLQRT